MVDIGTRTEGLRTSSDIYKLLAAGLAGRELWKIGCIT